MNRRNFLQLLPGLAAAPAAAQTMPNIVVILCDDLGYGDVGVYGSSIRTPNLDRMASEGMRFTQFTSANPVCSPSRASWLTGRYPTRVGVPKVLFPTDEKGLPDSEQTIAQALKTKGYKTMCVGKWHLGHKPAYLPMRRGFDEYFGIPYSNDMNPPVLLHNEDVVEQRATLDTLTQRYTERAVKFMENSKGAPFFLYMPHTMPHIPIAASKRFRGKSPQGLYGDVIEEIDWSVGEVLGTIKRLGLDRNTLVLFSSDNGPWFQGSPGRLRGRKGMTWEGGVRVPFIARMPGKIPAGKVCDAIASPMDVLPTVAKLCGITPKNALDGIDIWPLLSGQKKDVERDLLIYFDDVNAQCARMGRWKIHYSRYNNVTYSPAPAGGRVNLLLQTPELYDLSKDVDESYDVAPEHPEIVKQMTARLEQILQGFPEDIRSAWAQTKQKKNAESRIGTVSRQAQ
ncbi:MAG: sulfatase [Candidatus Solibacter usitatus]|nr:sulfatase [Candidatus Solibacter usitatus]